MIIKGSLYIIPTLIGDYDKKYISNELQNAIKNINYYLVENEKKARRFIKFIDPKKNQNILNIKIISKIRDLNFNDLLEPCKSGNHIGLLSDSGCPGIADPGSDVVLSAHLRNIEIKPIIGPSSILMAMMSSGLNGQSFSFNGYLPIKEKQLIDKIKFYESKSKKENQTQIFIETPYRNNKLLSKLIETLSPKSMLCVASNINLQNQLIITKKVFLWKKTKIDINKQPTIFIFSC
ncbi:MAG: SAM-dependent methyltransferase [Flavobacteriaceae bacterium]|nr:SAM-dependent methyltransferase [Flavobacteriaceae bacterium]